MNEEELIKRKIIDTANLAYKNNVFCFTNFLSLTELSIYHSLKKELSFIKSEVYYPLDICERAIIKFSSKEELGYDLDYPIKLLKISPLTPKFAQKLSHRDYLGAIMSLGIKRELIGDILVNEKEAFVFSIDHIADYIIENLTSISHTSIKVEMANLEDLSGFKKEREKIQIIAASNRLDSIVASLSKLSRSKVKDLFLSRKVFVNGLVNENVSYKLKEGEVLVIRGLGKFCFIETGGETKSGRIYLKFEKYV